MKKVITAFVTVCCLCFFIFGSAVYTYSLKMEKMNEKADSFNHSGDWHLTDHYDRKGHNYYEFLERKDSLTILKKVYQKLSELSKLEYYEVADQDIGIFGKFSGSEKLVSGGKDGLNQKADGTYYSPLKSIQLSKNYAESQSLSSSITEGRAFSDDDYKKDKNRIIPVIAGAGYKNIFDLNETFEGIYLGDMKIKYRIVGFLKSRSEIEIDQEHKKLDSYIICPNIQVTKNDSADFQKTLLSVKCEGYLHYNNKKEAQLLTHTIRKIVKETGYQYDIPRLIRCRKIYWDFRQGRHFYFLLFLLYYLYIAFIKYMDYGSKNFQQQSAGSVYVPHHA